MDTSEQYNDIVYNTLNLFTVEEEMVEVEILKHNVFVMKHFKANVVIKKNFRLAIELIENEDNEYDGILQYYSIGTTTTIKIPKSKYLLIKRIFLKLYKKFYNYLITVERAAKLMYGKDSTWLARVDKLLPIEFKNKVGLTEQYFYVLIIRIPDHVITSQKYPTGFYLEHDIKGLYIKLGFRLGYDKMSLSIDILAKRNILNINEIIHGYISAHIGLSNSWGGICFGSSSLGGALVALGENLHENDDTIEIAFLSFALTLNTFLSKEDTFGSPYMTIKSLELYFYKKVTKPGLNLRLVNNMLEISKSIAKNINNFKLVEYEAKDTIITVFKKVIKTVYTNIYDNECYELRISDLEDLDVIIKEAIKRHTPVIFKHKVLPLQVEQNYMISTFKKLEEILDEFTIPLETLI